MKLKAVSGIMLTMLLISMLTLAFNIQPVRSDWTLGRTETIYIMADGSVDPPTAPISSVDSITYTLTDNILTDVILGKQAIVVKKDNIVFDGANYTLQGTEIVDEMGKGILLDRISNVTIKNMKINTFNCGIEINGCSNNTISGNNITNSITGIEIFRSNGIIATGNVITKDFTGIAVDRTNGSNIFDNVILSNYMGMVFGYCGYNIIYHNNFIDNDYQAVSIGTIYPNIWDNGYPSGGNYWNDYAGVDVKSGANQDQPSSDGIGDTAYVIYTNNTDHYPLMYPWGGLPPHSYTLTVHSSPTGVTFTADGISHTTPWSRIYGEGASVSLVMPKTHKRYLWSHWLEDGDTNRIKTVTMDTNIMLTAVYEPAPPSPVGGKATPINKAITKPELQIPWIWMLTITFPLVLTVAYIQKRKKHPEIDS